MPCVIESNGDTIWCCDLVSLVATTSAYSHFLIFALIPAPPYAKLVTVIGPPLRHANPFVPMGAAVISCRDAIPFAMGQRALDRIRMPET